MEPTQINTEQLIARYLAGQLPANESDAFERAVSEDPNLRDKTEQVLRFREGLARLRERGELDTLVRTPAPRRWLPYAVAAGVAVAALGILPWLNQPPPLALLARSPSEFATRQLEPPPVLGSYVLARTRGGMALTDVGSGKTVGWIELRAVPSVLSPGARYTVQVRHLDGPARGAIAGQIDRLSAAPDGYVTTYLNLHELEPGDYELSLAPSPAAATSLEADRFVIRVH
jgi:hypothetical protein